jgi:enterochelin esterase-like enzyme
VLATLGISHRLVVVPGHHNGKTWRGQMSAALEYALAPTASAPPSFEGRVSTG